MSDRRGEDPTNLLHDEEPGTRFGDYTEKLAKQRAAGIVQRATTASGAETLTTGPRRDHHWLPLPETGGAEDVGGGQILDLRPQDDDVGPVHLDRVSSPAVRLNGDADVKACVFEPEIETERAREE
jgi:hypothetical protein